MKRRKRSGLPECFACLLALWLVTPLLADPSTPSATQPSAASVISDMDSAYAKLQTAQFDGTLTGHFDVAGQKKDQTVSFTSSFSAPNQFRHEIPAQILLVSTGKTVYSRLTARDEYQSADAPKARGPSRNWPGSISRLLLDQNPSLLLAISDSATGEMNQLSDRITLQPATALDGVAYDTLSFQQSSDDASVTMLIDPASHLLRQVKTDLRHTLLDQGCIEVKAAEITIDYTRSASNIPMPAEAFNWTPSTGSILLTDDADEGLTDDMKALIGKDAPDFSLADLSGKPVKLSDTPGSVVVLDFWAIWCGPCVAAMPHLDQLYKDHSAGGLKVYAINQMDDKDKLIAFVKKQGWTLPVLLDPDAVAAGLYRAESLPETVVIGKDGKVKGIFAGIHHQADITKLVQQEMK